MKTEFIISPNVTEQDVVEHCFNLKAAGYTYDHILGIYAFIKTWHIDKFIYYKNLIQESFGE